MPFFALALNLSWEFLFSFIFGGSWSLQKVINVTWFFLDVAILYTYFRYGRKEFPSSVDQKWFLPWSWLAIATLGPTVGYHRLLAHRRITAAPA